MTNKTNKTNFRTKKPAQTDFSTIYAGCYVSESELKEVFEDYDPEIERKNPGYFASLLWQMGLNTNADYMRYDDIPHRNRMNNVVTCSRWVGYERHDKEWLESGYASREALDRDRNSPLLDSLYKQKNATVEIQAYLNDKDRDCKVDE